jgi:crotonobetainyl-CoA:carnitine CoA-transferase CaiB-like acyl-CoA transferase
MIVDIYDPVIERNIKMVGCPIKMPEHEPVYGAFPALGGDTEAILKKLGYTDANIAAFREDGSI